jgi:hypothetical protein
MLKHHKTNSSCNRNISAFDAISKSQEIVYSPMIFQTVYVLVNHNILKFIEDCKNGIAFNDLIKKTDFNDYALGLLLDVAVSASIIYLDDNGLYHLSKIGYFLQNDRMTRISLDFVKHVCYRGLDSLEDSLLTLEPCGLKDFNKSWQTIYPHLSELPTNAQQAWFAWDHFYSQTSFLNAIKIIDSSIKPRMVYDIGGNTGDFARTYLQYNHNIKVKILDLPSQIRLSKENFKDNNYNGRIDFEEIDILTHSFTEKCSADVIWLSQFLDCFAKEHIAMILKNLNDFMRDDTVLCILEPIADRQKFDAARLSINCGSLYFNTIANGYSKFLSTKELELLLLDNGFKIVDIYDELGVSNSMFVCSKQP